MRTLPHHHLIAVCLILLVASLFRVWLIDVDGAAFESDEAIVGLMAHHINTGEPLPTFFYGQAYMGSLDALLVAGGFQLLGESVDTIRIVQLALYLIALITGYALARTVTGSDRIAALALLLLAIPTALGALYTTITLGGYNELVILGNLVLLLSWQVTIERRTEAWRWLALGLAAGLGWWVNGAIVTVCLVAGLLGLTTFTWRNWRNYGIVLIGFLIGSAPWWAYNFQHDWAALKFLTEGFEGETTATISTGEALLGLLVLGLPALYGLRYPWAGDFPLTLGVIVGGIVYLLLVTDMIAGARRRSSPPPPYMGEESVNHQPTNGILLPLALRERGPGGEGQIAQLILARRWVWLVFGVFAAVFVLSSFADATGRYLMPVWVPAAIGVALGLDRFRRAAWWLPAVLIGGLLILHAGLVMQAATSANRLTPQLVERLRIPAGDEARLLDWLAEHDTTRGYASYWTAYRLTFRSGEAVIFDVSLPHDSRGYQAGYNRYPPYIDAVSAAERVVWITQQYPALDAAIAELLAAANISYQTEQIGVYRVYYDFSQRVSPLDVGIDTITLPDD